MLGKLWQPWMGREYAIGSPSALDGYYAEQVVDLLRDARVMGVIK